MLLFADHEDKCMAMFLPLFEGFSAALKQDIIENKELAETEGRTSQLQQFTSFPLQFVSPLPSHHALQMLKKDEQYESLSRLDKLDKKDKRDTKDKNSLHEQNGINNVHNDPNAQQLLSSPELLIFPELNAWNRVICTNSYRNTLQQLQSTDSTQPSITNQSLNDNTGSIINKKTNTVTTNYPLLPSQFRSLPSPALVLPSNQLVQLDSLLNSKQKLQITEDVSDISLTTSSDDDELWGYTSHNAALSITLPNDSATTSTTSTPMMTKNSLVNINNSLPSPTNLNAPPLPSRPQRPLRPAGSNTNTATLSGKIGSTASVTTSIKSRSDSLQDLKPTLIHSVNSNIPLSSTNTNNISNPKQLKVSLPPPPQFEPPQIPDSSQSPASHSSSDSFKLDLPGNQRKSIQRQMEQSQQNSTPNMNHSNKMNKLIVKPSTPTLDSANDNSYQQIPQLLLHHNENQKSLELVQNAKKQIDRHDKLPIKRTIHFYTPPSSPQSSSTTLINITTNQTSLPPISLSNLANQLQHRKPMVNAHHNVNNNLKLNHQLHYIN
jgi:hypothetical protein